MNAKTVFGSAIILTLAFVLAAQYKNAPGRPADFRDAPVSEGAVEQLQKAAPADQDLTQPEPAIPSPQAAEPAAVEPAGSADAAAQSAGDPKVTRIFSENDPWHKRLAEALGVNYPCNVETKRLGKFYNNVKKLTFDDGRRRVSVAVKVFDPLTGAKFFPRKVLAPYIPVHATPGGRLKNTIEMTEKFNNAGFKTLEIVLTDPEKKILVTRFVKGTGGAEIQLDALQGDPDALKLIGRIGSAYAALHRSNFTIGDPNPDNIMLIDGELRFVDPEQAAVGGKKGYDIAAFFYLPIARDRPRVKPQAWAAVARSYLQGYLAGGGDPGDVRKALRREYLLLFLYAVPTGGLNPIREVRHEMKEAAGEGPAEESDEALGLAP